MKNYNRLVILAALVLLVGYNVFADITTGLVAHYKFENASNLGEDTTGNNNGTVVGGVTSTDGIIDKCASFDGTSTIQVANNASLNSEDGVTYAAWVKTAVIEPEESLTVFGHGWNNWIWLIHYGSADSFNPNQLAITHLKHDGNRNDGSVRIDDGEWHHVAAVYDDSGPETQLFIDGVLNNAKTITSAGFTARDTDLFIGASPDDLTNPSPKWFMNGAIDDFRVYNRTLSEVDMLELYKIAMPPESTSSVSKDNWELYQ